MTARTGLLTLGIAVVMVVIMSAISISEYQDYISHSRLSSGVYKDPVERALNKLPWGNIAFNNPRTMAYGETVVVQLLLSGNRASDEILLLTDEAGEKETYRVQFSNDMEASLVGSSFEISPITDERQAVSRSGIAEWKWQIKAKELGEQRLYLVLNAHMTVNDHDMPYVVRTFSRELKVQIVWPQSVKYFLWSYWQWVCTAIALPLVGWLVSLVIRRHRPEKP